MEVTDGNLSWAATLDISGISKAKDTLVKYLKDMGLSAEEAGKRADEAMKGLTEAFSDAMKEVKSESEALDVLKDALDQVKENIEGLEDGVERDFLSGVAEGMEEVIEEMERAQTIENPLENIEEKAPSARQALREMTEELTAMKMRGEENTEAYQQLLEKVGTLKDAMMDTQQAVKGMASDTANLDAVLGAAQLAAGGFSAAMGALNLIDADEDTKKLAEAQKKLQAVIAITTGLQSVQNALQKDSALMLGIQRAKTLALAKAEDVHTSATMKGVAATKAATAAQNGLNTAVSKNPYAIITLAILSGVAALTKWLMYDRETEKQSKKTALALSNEVAVMERLVQLNSKRLDNLNEGYEKLKEDFDLTANFEAYSQGIKKLIKDENSAFDELIASDDFLKNNFIHNSQDVEKEVKKQRELIEQEKKKIVEYEAEGRNYLTGELRGLKKINEANDKIAKAESKLEKLVPYYQKSEALRKKHNLMLEELASKEFDIKQKEIDDTRALTDAKISQMKEGYAKEIATIKSGRAAEREALQAQIDNPNSGLTVEEKGRIEQKIKESDKTEAAEIAEVYKKQGEAIRKAEEELMELEYGLVQKRINQRTKQRQTEIDLMADGSAKELEQMRLDHAIRLVEIEREAKEEADALREYNKQKWLNEQAKKGRQVTDADWYASSAYKSLFGGLTEEQRKQISDQQKQDEANANAIAEKQYKDFLQQLLRDYGDFNAQKKAMDDAYWQDYNTIATAYVKATTEEERDIYSKAMDVMEKDKARKTLDLNLAKIDTTVYDTVEEKMEAINKAYATYIESIRQAGASEAEINAAVEEQLELTGRLARLEAQRADLEARIRNIQQGGIDKEGLSLEELLELLAKVNKELANATETKSFKQVWDANKNTLVSKSIDLVTDSLYRLADASGSLNAKEAADFLSSLSKGLQGFQQGGFIGVLIAGIEDTLAQISEDIIKAQAVEAAIKNAAVDKWTQDMAAMMEQGKGGIFGDDTLANVNSMVSILDEAKKKLAEFGAESQVFSDDFNRILGATNLLNWQNWAMAFTETSNAVRAYTEALDNGYNKVEAHALRTQDRGWLANFFGIDDKYDNLKDMVEGLGYELYDQYGNLNAEALQAILDTYTDLSEEDKKWIEEAIAYSEEYEEAMQGVADYLNSLFGQVADTIADQFIDSFLESGQAAMDFGSVVSDVARNMVKDLIKSMILQEVMNKYSEQFKSIITGGQYQDDNARTAAMLQLFMQMGAEIEGLQPAVQALLAAYQQYIGDLDNATTEIIGGNMLQSASQDSVDLLNGQLNAIRTNQALMASRFDSALLQLSGIYDEVRDFHGDSNIKLDQLIDNTSEGGSILRQLGIWIG